MTEGITKIHGYVARDNTAKRIVISIRGTDSFANTMIDSLSFFITPGKIPRCPTCRVHAGFYLASQSVTKTIAEALTEQFAIYPNYGLLITGHSMGGAVASLLVSPGVKSIETRAYHINNRAKSQMLSRLDSLVLEILHLRHS